MTDGYYWKSKIFLKNLFDLKIKSTVDIQYISFRYTTLWLDIYVAEEVITLIHLVPSDTVHGYYNVIDYIPMSPLHLSPWPFL